MNFNHHQNGDEGESENVVKSGIPVTITPQGITSFIAVIGIIGTLFWTISDFRVSMNEITTRQLNTTERINIIEKRMDEAIHSLETKINNIDNSGTRQLVAIDAIVKSMKEQLEAVKDSVDSVNGAIEQHNSSMYDLYKRDNPNKPLPRHHTGNLPAITAPRAIR